MDFPAARVRSSVDAVALSGTLVLILVLVGFGTVADRTNVGANADVSRAVDKLPNWLVDAIGIIGGFTVLAVLMALIVRMLVRGQRRLLIEALLAGALSLGLIVIATIGLEHAKGSALYGGLILVRQAGPTAPLDAFLAAWFTFLAVGRIGTDRTWRRIVVGAVLLYSLSVFAAAQATLLSLVISAAAGVAVGLGLRYFFGTVNSRPDARRIADALAATNLPLQRIEPVLGVGRRHRRRFLAVGTDGRIMDVVVLDRDQSATGWFYGAYRAFRVRPEVATGPEFSIERAAERRTLLALAGQRVGAALPSFRGSAPCGPDAVVLAYDHIEATSLIELAEPPTDDQVRELWSSVERLHASRISHPALTPARIKVEANGRILLPVFEDGTTLANDLRISLDRAQLIATCAEVVGAERAVKAARESIGPTEFTAALRALQPVAFGRETRRWIKGHPSFLDDIRAAAQIENDVEIPELSRLERVRPRTVLTLVGLVIAATLLIGQLGSVDLLSVLRSAKWQWLPLIVAGSALTYFAAGLALVGYVREKLPYLRTVSVQLAAGFVGFVMPPAVGGAALNVRYLQNSGLGTTAAATSVATNHVGNALTHIALLTVLVTATGSTSERHSPIPGWAFLVLGGLAAVALIAMTIPMIRKIVVARLLPPIREVVPRLVGLINSPLKLAQAFGGALLLNATFIGTLWFSIRAFNADIGLAAVAVVYLAGSAVGSAAPTPGGIGAVEAALSAGLVTVGMAGSSAISAVLLFRLATFWLPVPLGWVALSALQRRGAL
ncbi:MAG: hypothetical protein JWM76_1086 [Pseudonocardiales bacterium]|nr:hypothetical protein [Pseudonocardiales bacterium]